ncbi:MAG: tetratricopeptide repeat protein [Phycisphaerales bacterium]
MASGSDYLARAEELYRAARLEEAIKMAQRAVAAEPGNVQANWALGQMLSGASRHPQAEFYLSKVVQLSPRFVTARVALSRVLAALGKPAEALAAADEALAIEPGSPAAQLARASVLASRQRYGEAIAAMDEADRLAPGEPAFHLRTALMAELGKCDQWLYERLGSSAAAAAGPEGVNPWAYYACACSRLSAEELAAVHRRVGDEVAGWPLPPGAAEPLRNAPDPERVLRVGFVSSDICEHPVAYFLEPLLEHLDRTRARSTLYINCDRGDEMTKRLCGHAESHRMVAGLSETALAKRVRDDGIDVLVDLAGHTDGSAALMFRSRLAPVQVNWLGYPHSTGLRCFEGRLVDSSTDPAGSERLASEPLVRLDPCFICYKPPGVSPDVPVRSEGPPTFGSFNSLWKLSDATAALWARVLEATPGSRLLLKGGAFADAWAREQFAARFAALGVDRQRLELIGRTPGTAPHLALYGRVDVALDPTPYNGTTTTCEAMHMGVPVVTLAGDRHGARVGMTLLRGVGLDELVAPTADAYVEIAAGLAGDGAKLAELRRTLRSRLAGSVVCDGPAFARRFEGGVRGLWRAWCQGRTDGG